MSDSYTVERWPVVDLKLGDRIWADECNDFVMVLAVEQEFPRAPVFLDCIHECGHVEIDHDHGNVALRIVGEQFTADFAEAQRCIREDDTEGLMRLAGKASDELARRAAERARKRGGGISPEEGERA